VSSIFNFILKKVNDKNITLTEGNYARKKHFYEKPNLPNLPAVRGGQHPAHFASKELAGKLYR